MCPAMLIISLVANGHFRITLCFQLPYLLVPSGSPMKVFLHQHPIPQWFPLRHLCSAVTPVSFQFGAVDCPVSSPLLWIQKKNLLISHSLFTFLLVRIEWLLPNLLQAEPETRCPFSLFQSERAPWSFL